MRRSASQARTLAAAIVAAVAVVAVASGPVVAEPVIIDPAPVPTDGEPIVRRILVDTGPLFDPDEDPDFGSAPFTWLNEIKIPTFEWVLRREVLVRPGEPLDLRLIRESERNIRSLGFVRGVRIEVRPVDERRVDLVVRAQETWTFQPRLSGSLGGGQSNASVGITEANLFGLGTQLGVAYTDDVERDTLRFRYRDRRILGSRYDSTISYAQLSDGRLRAFSIEQPFYSFDTRFAYGISLYDEIRRDNLYDLGEEVREWEHEVGRVQTSFGLNLRRPGPIADRLIFSHTYADDRFAEVEVDPASPLPEDRRYSALGVRWAHIEDTYVVRRRIASFERQEDFNLGNDYSLSLAYSPELLGSRDDAWFFGSAWHDGLMSGEWLTLGDLALSSRLRRGTLENVVGRWSVQSYYTGLPSQTVAFSWAGTATARRDAEDRFVVGGLDELRGYPDRWVNGPGGFVGHVEDRIFLVDRILGIASLGAAVFYDVAAAIDEDPAFGVGKVYHSIGLGLRIGLPVSSVGRVVRMDVAWALNDTGDDSRIGISITTGQVFDPFESFL